MKKVILLLAMSSLLSTMLLAQSKPEGINYQAVARNLKGEILANQPIALKVKLFSLQSSGKAEYYNEVHDVVTSATGVFSLVIGKGKPESGFYDNIPWSLENIWMEVSIKSKGQSDFAIISNSKLLAVPYAYHSLTAEKLTGEKNAANAGNPAQAWLLFGNRSSNPVEDKLGTTDSVDLVMVTNNLERLRMYANGNIFMQKSLRVGANLTVDSSAYLNKIGGATINYGPFTVDRQSPTLLSGTLTVDKATDLNSSLNVDGITDLNSKLNVNNNSPTVLTGTLRVDGVTDLNSALNVNNVSPTLLTGILQVDKNALFKERLKIESTYQTDTSGANPGSGALQVNGGASIGKNLYIGGIAKFGGPAAFGGAVTITDASESVSTSTGALMIPYGGVGIGKRLNVGGGGLFESTLGVAGITSITNATQSTAANNGALILAGGAGIGKNVNIGGNLTTTGITTLNNTLNVNASSSYIANFVNSTDANGISIQVAAGTPDSDNDFINFKNSSGNTVGRIEGQTESELLSSDDYKDELASRAYDVTAGIIDLLFASIDLGQAISHNIGAAASVNVCAGLGVVACPPIISLIASSAVNLGLAIAQEIVVIADVVFASVNLGKFIQNQKDQVGVSYASSSGDYAEYLLRADVNERIGPGDIVGIKGGRVSKKTAGAEKMMVVSHKPIVLGNMPSAENEMNYEKIAFMGQVPVKVFGTVKLGDYIIPNEVNNGVGKAVSPDKITSSQIKSIVGIAWSEAKEPLQISMINVGVGLNVNDNQKLVDELTKEINELKNGIEATNQQLVKLVPGFKANGIVNERAVTGNVTAPAQENVYSKIPYHKVVKQDILNGFNYAEKVMRENGIDVEKHAFFAKCKSEPGYKNMLVDRLVIKFNAAIEEQKKINEAKAVQINNLRPEN